MTASYTNYSIVGTGSYLPDDCVENKEIEARLNLSPGWIEERTGISLRHIAAPHQATSDLMVSAAREALAAADVDAGDIRVLIACTTTPDELGPATACRVQARLGADRAAAFDIGAACTGFLIGCKVALAYLSEEADPRRRALVVGGEVLSRFTDPGDRPTAVLFGDGAAAAVLGPVQAPGGMGRVRLGSDGRYADSLLIPGSGSRPRPGPGSPGARSPLYRMDGRAIKGFISDVFPRLVAEGTAEAGVGTDALRFVVSHQPNPKLLASLAEPAGLTDRQLPITGGLCGNIGAAGLAHALDTVVRRTPPEPGNLILLTAFGAGANWGRALIRWSGPR